MNEENFKNLFWGTVKWVLVVAVTLGVLGGLFWAIFYSDYFANLPFIIATRNLYHFTNIQSEVSQWPGTFVYSFQGTFVGYDSKQDILSLKAQDGKIYNFTTGRDLVFTPTSDGNYSPQDNSPGIDKTSVNNIKLDGTPTSSNSLMQITWDDTRTLSQINTDYAENSSVPLNQKSTKIFGLTKFN